MPKTEKKQTTSDEVVVDLDAAMEDGMNKFAGELEEAAGGPGESQEAEPGPAKEGESNEELEKRQEEERKKSEETKGGEEEEPIKPRFETHEKAEEGYRNLQSEKTRVDQALAEMKKKEAEDERAQQAEADRKKLRKDTVEYSKTRNKEALDAINDLDPEADDYDETVAGILADKDTDINLFVAEHGVPMTVIEETTPPDSGDETKPGENAGLPADATPEQAKTYMEDRVKKAGIDPADAFFLNTSRLIPKTDPDTGQPILTFDDQIDFAIKTTQKYRDSITTGIKTEQQKEADRIALENQKRGLTLDASIADPVPKDEDKDPPVVTLENALDSAAEERRLL